MRLNNSYPALVYSQEQLLLRLAQEQAMRVAIIIFGAQQNLIRCWQSAMQEMLKSSDQSSMATTAVPLPWDDKKIADFYALQEPAGGVYLAPEIRARLLGRHRDWADDWEIKAIERDIERQLKKSEFVAEWQEAIAELLGDFANKARQSVTHRTRLTYFAFRQEKGGGLPGDIHRIPFFERHKDKHAELARAVDEMVNWVHALPSQEKPVEIFVVRHARAILRAINDQDLRLRLADVGVPEPSLA